MEISRSQINNIYSGSAQAGSRFIFSDMCLHRVELLLIRMKTNENKTKNFPFYNLLIKKENLREVAGTDFIHSTQLLFLTQ